MADKEDIEDIKLNQEKDDDNAADRAANIATQAANNTFNSAKNMASEATSKVTEELSSAVEKTTEMLSNPSVLYGLIAVIIIAIICVIIIYYFIANSVFNKKYTIVEKTKFPVKGMVRSKIPIENFPSSGNGLKRTYTFWIYIQDLSNASGMAKHVFSIGDDSIKNNSPIVFIGKGNENKLYVRFPSSDAKFDNFYDMGTSDSKKYTNTVCFDYIPLQRWVHIGVVISDNYQGPQISLYMDAQLVKNVVDKQDTGDETITEYTFDKLNLDKSGTLVVGGDSTSGSLPGFNGLLSKVGIHNYDLNSRDIHQIYNEGPIDGLLASVGYGVRTPIYKLAD